MTRCTFSSLVQPNLCAIFPVRANLESRLLISPRLRHKSKAGLVIQSEVQRELFLIEEFLTSAPSPITDQIHSQTKKYLWVPEKNTPSLEN